MQTATNLRPSPLAMFDQIILKYLTILGGNLGQVIYVAPQKNMVVVRSGPEPDPGVVWSFMNEFLVDQMP